MYTKTSKTLTKDQFELLVLTKKDMLYKIAFSYTKNHDDALDIVQDAVIKAYTSLKKLKNPDHFNTWLVRILINTAYNHIKKTKRLTAFSPEMCDNGSEMTVDYLDLSKALDSLKPKDRVLIQLKFFEDMTFTEVAKVLALPEGTVKSRYYKILKQLKKLLKEAD